MTKRSTASLDKVSGKARPAGTKRATLRSPAPGIADKIGQALRRFVGGEPKAEGAKGKPPIEKPRTRSPKATGTKKGDLQPLGAAPLPEGEGVAGHSSKGSPVKRNRSAV